MMNYKQPGTVAYLVIQAMGSTDALVDEAVLRVKTVRILSRDAKTGAFYVRFTTWKNSHWEDEPGTEFFANEDSLLEYNASIKNNEKPAAFIARMNRDARVILANAHYKIKHTEFADDLGAKGGTRLGSKQNQMRKIGI